ncbi:MAG TPA: peptide chain release factor N(5)-glutamine methyltransferase [Coxiellaceae bacterium]|nr:peptide chain release factor N(5)-glutamine methyltransferase [Coxiellaceae bacterium]
MSSKKITYAPYEQKNEPLAYVLGKETFWKMELIVTRDTLIPRPETECMVRWILTHCTQDKIHLADLGTGTGAIAIALSSEKPQWCIDVTDISEKALNVAKQNAKKHACPNISFYLGDWCAALPNKKYDLIVSHPPCVIDDELQSFMDLTHEPQQALEAGKKGLDAIISVIQCARTFLKSNGTLVIQHAPDQMNDVIDLFQKAGFSTVSAFQDLSGVNRFVAGTL